MSSSELGGGVIMPMSIWNDGIGVGVGVGVGVGCMDGWLGVGVHSKIAGIGKGRAILP